MSSCSYKSHVTKEYSIILISKASFKSIHSFRLFFPTANAHALLLSLFSTKIEHIARDTKLFSDLTSLTSLKHKTKNDLSPYNVCRLMPTVSHFVFS